MCEARRLQERMREHQERRGSEWTRRYQPLRDPPTIVEVPPKPFDAYAEDDIVYELMQMDDSNPPERGINSVRGGSHMRCDLDEGERTMIKRKLAHARGNCMLCLQPGHFCSGCPLR